MTLILLAIIYLSFISLGLPDALLGAAWPTMYPELSVPVSYAGILAALSAMCTVVSSLVSDRLIRRLGTGRLTAVSAGMTAAALMGFSYSRSFWALCLWSLPCGLGAGCVDAALNHYVALHYASRHMSWLHCMWGVGASVGPYFMAYALTGGGGWPMGYRYIALLQMALTAVLVVSLPLWHSKSVPAEKAADSPPLSLPQILRIDGAKEAMITFFCYCGLEQTAALWAASYLVLHLGTAEETAASMASLFFIGITTGRGLSGFLTLKLRDSRMVILGQAIIALGVAVLALPLEGAAVPGLLLIGLGCAPIYPCLLHATPEHFGPERSQAVIGVQMACAYVGSCLMPPLFGLAANHITPALFPVYLAAILALMAVMHLRLLRKTGAR